MAKRREKGDGSIYQRKSDGLYVGYARTPDGKKKYVYDKTRGGVSKKLKELQRNLEQGTHITANKAETVEQYLDYWLSIHRAQVKESTYVGHVHHLKPVYAVIGKIKLQKLTADQIQKMYASMQGNKKASTIRQTHIVLKAALKAAVKWKRLSSNPAIDVPVPRVEKHVAVVLTPEQAQKLLAQLVGHQLECFISLALATGMRRGELLALRWADIDFAERTLIVNHTVSYLIGDDGKYHYVETSPKTKAGRRTISLPQFVLDVLKVHRTKQLEARMKAASWIDKDLVFYSADGDFYGVQGLRMQFGKILQQAELPHMRIHDLRHSAATLLLKMKVPAKVVQELLGHSSIQITQDIYGHLFPGMQEEAMGKMNDLLKQSI